MPRRPCRRYQVGRFQLAVRPRRKRPNPWRRFKGFIDRHHRLIGVLAVIGIGIGLVIVHERALAAVTFVSVMDRVADLIGYVVSDRVFKKT